MQCNAACFMWLVLVPKLQMAGLEPCTTAETLPCRVLASSTERHCITLWLSQNCLGHQPAPQSLRSLLSSLEQDGKHMAARQSRPLIMGMLLCIRWRGGSHFDHWLMSHQPNAIALYPEVACMRPHNAAGSLPCDELEPQSCSLAQEPRRASLRPAC